ncbi:Potassium transporter 5 family protein [Dorcoceras hygrometricum]|uniref:Potassium transporter n=1 Tax=Dorcoceras hygrometricum TaxID=472368 RepID=A0A2Z7D9N2_9LAMI|nr:Potassium transporter 5 family protein [Dorcoceras hygrometricum]
MSMADQDDPMAPNAGSTNRKASWGRLRRVDSFNMEAGNVSSKHATHGGSSHQASWRTTLSLAFQSMGVIYGDIGTSPLYVYASTFTHGIQHKDDILGVLSLIIYTIVLVPMIKYVFLVLRANDNGDGGTFALYSLICRYANVSLIPNNQPEDAQLSNYRLQTPSAHLRRAQKIKEKLEKSRSAKVVLFLATILGTSMVIGDGVLTPCISVLSAVSGIKGVNQDTSVYISIAILIVLFCVQRLGTDRVGSTFAPAICLWFLFISGIGAYNLFKYEPGVLRAFNPMYIMRYFRRNGHAAWVSLGGVVLCITGTEAMFADLGHFNLLAVQISFSGIVFPALLFAYIGQASYLSKFPDHVKNTFYDSIPGPLYWPTFVVANAAAIIASQAMISGAFAIVSQSLSQSCFPRVKVVHTSSKYEGQVYIPDINYILMIACIVVTYGFKSTEKIGNAYGIAVVSVMLITTSLVTLIMLFIWKTKIWWICLFFLLFMSVELVYLSSVLYKFSQGGYLPLAFSLVLMAVMGTWHYAQQQRYMFEMRNKVSSVYVRDLAKNADVTRLPGIGLLYSELVQGIPPIFLHFVSNVPSIHSVVVMVSIKAIPISYVTLDERFLFRQVEPRESHVYRCVVRYGYKDAIEEPHEFERQLVHNLKDFIRHEHFIHDGLVENEPTHEDEHENARKSTSSAVVPTVESIPEHHNNTTRISSSSIQSISSGSRNVNIPPALIQGVEEDMKFVDKAMEQGVFYLIGEAEVVAKKDSSLLKKIIINYAYTFLRKNFRHGGKVLAIPQTRLLKVGMTYEI